MVSMATVQGSLIPPSGQIKSMCAVQGSEVKSGKGEGREKEKGEGRLSTRHFPLPTSHYSLSTFH